MIVKKKQQKKIKIGIVASRFNDLITKRLLEGCVSELLKKGIKKSDILISWVPGAFEIPVAALKLAKKRNIDAVICLGAVIRGETYHFEMVSQGCALGILQASIKTEKPVMFGVLTTDTVDQAQKRSKDNGDNKGVDVALAALDMIKVLSNI